MKELSQEQAPATADGELSVGMFKKVIKMQCMITQKFDDPKTPKELFIS